MTTIIGIHGLANKPPAGQRAEWWDAAIRDGLHRNKNFTNPDFTFTSVYWADYMYGPDAGAAGEEPYPYMPDDMLKANRPLMTYQDGWLDELRADASKYVGNALDFLKGKLDIEHAAAAVLEWKLKDLHRYYEEPGTREELRWRLKQAVKEALAADGKTMVISHSMGTIIAFDALQELSAECPAGTLDHWITLGSPLGLPHVVLQIAREWGEPATPALVARWTNFADKRDPVAADTHLRDDYAKNAAGVGVRDDLVINDYGGIHHKSYGYLRAPEVSEAIAVFLGG